MGDSSHSWACTSGDWIEYAFDGERRVGEIAATFDSALERNITLTLHHRSDYGLGVPDVLPRKLRIDGLVSGGWETLHRIGDNHQRFVRLPVNRMLGGIRLTVEETWGSRSTCVYAFCVR